MAQFTAENAAEMARRAAESKRLRLEELRTAVQIAVTDPNVDFTVRTLARVRLQMENISNEIDKAIGRDSKVLRELTDAYTRLEVIEQKLSMRHAPGATKPTTSRRSTPSQDPSPVEIPTQPIVSSAPIVPPVEGNTPQV